MGLDFFQNPAALVFDDGGLFSEGRVLDSLGDHVGIDRSGDGNRPFVFAFRWRTGFARRVCRALVGGFCWDVVAIFCDLSRGALIIHSRLIAGVCCLR